MPPFVALLTWLPPLAILAETWLMLHQNRRRWRLVTAGRLTARAGLFAASLYFIFFPQAITPAHFMIGVVITVYVSMEAVANLARRKAGDIAPVKAGGAVVEAKRE